MDSKSEAELYATTLSVPLNALWTQEETSAAVVVVVKNKRKREHISQ